MMVYFEMPLFGVNGVSCISGIDAVTVVVTFEADATYLYIRHV